MAVLQRARRLPRRSCGRKDSERAAKRRRGRDQGCCHRAAAARDLRHMAGRARDWRSRPQYAALAPRPGTGNDWPRAGCDRLDRALITNALTSVATVARLVPVGFLKLLG